MPLKRIVKLDTGSIAAGGFVDLNYAPEVDLKLKRIQVIEITAGDYANIFLTLYLAGEPIFQPDVNASVLKFDNPNLPTFDRDHAKGDKLITRVSNIAGATRRLIIHLVYE
jgi:hypothetical protein